LDLPGPVTLGTLFGRTPWRCSCPLTLITEFRLGYADIFLDTKSRLFKGDFHVVPEVGAFGWSPAPLAACPPEKHVKNIAKTAKVLETTAKTGFTGPVSESRMAELVILGLFLGVGKYFISLTYLFEFGLCLLITRIYIRVVLAGQFSKGLF